MSIRHLDRVIAWRYPDGHEELTFVGTDHVGEPMRISIQASETLMEEISKARFQAKQDANPRCVGVGIQQVGE